MKRSDTPEGIEFAPPESGNCVMRDCGKPYIWQIGLKIWALHHPKDSHPPIELYSGLFCCDEHKEIGGELLLKTPQIRETLARTVQGMGRVMPDFDTAEVVYMGALDG